MNFTPNRLVSSCREPAPSKGLRCFVRVSTENAMLRNQFLSLCLVNDDKMVNILFIVIFVGTELSDWCSPNPSVGVVGAHIFWKNYQLLKFCFWSRFTSGGSLPSCKSPQQRFVSQDAVDVCALSSTVFADIGISAKFTL